MRVLVTGHNRDIGSVLRPLLAHEGHEIVGDFQSRKYTRLLQIKHLLAANLLNDTLRWRDPHYRTSVVMPGAKGALL